MHDPGRLSEVVLDEEPALEKSPESEAGDIENLKYGIYLTVLLICAFGALVSWFLAEPIGIADLFNTTNALVTMFCTGLAAILLWKKERAVRLIELLGYSAAAVYFLLNSYYVLYAERDQGVQSGELTGLFTWLPLVYIIAYLVFGARRGLVASGIFYVALVAITLPVITSAFRSGEEQDVVHAFAQLYLSHAVVIILLFIFAYFIKAYAKATALAEHMRRLADTDYLTGLPNRRRLYPALEQALGEAIRYDRPFTLIMFDLDNFKWINTAYGHYAGDAVLEEMARLIRGRLRRPDQFARWGGEEFVILAPETTLESGCSLAERLRHLMEDHDFGVESPITASFGVTEYQADDTSDGLLKRADEALRWAKDAGRNRVVSQD